MQTLNDRIAHFTEIKTELDSPTRDIDLAIALNPLNIAAHYNRLLAALDNARFDIMLFILVLQPLVSELVPNSDESDDREPIRNRLRAEFGDMVVRLSELQTTVTDTCGVVHREATAICSLETHLRQIATNMRQVNRDTNQSDQFSEAQRFFGVSEILAKTVRRDTELVVRIFEQSDYLVDKDYTLNDIDPTDCTSVIRGLTLRWGELMNENTTVAGSLPNINYEGQLIPPFSRPLFKSLQEMGSMQNAYIELSSDSSNVNFVFNRYVASGSDDGNMFVWDAESMELVSIIHGDTEVVNIIEDHPFLPIIAVSGIDYEIRNNVVYSYPAVSTNIIDEETQIVSRNEGMRLDALAHASLSSHIMNSILLGGSLSIHGDSSDTSIDDDDESMESEESPGSDSDESAIIELDQHANRRVQQHFLQATGPQEHESDNDSTNSY
ncbi:hypothetical protein LPJ81_002207 [Coemansia sp. IMI 209127]|nr:hypothetical protein LPJ81_002207 [Coemansia sp. IMI 209127]